MQSCIYSLVKTVDSSFDIILSSSPSSTTQADTKICFNHNFLCAILFPRSDVSFHPTPSGLFPTIKIPLISQPILVVELFFNPVVSTQLQEEKLPPIGKRGRQVRILKDLVIGSADLEVRSHYLQLFNMKL